MLVQTGIGRAGALMFAREGAAVALVARRREPLQDVASEIARAGGRAAVEAIIRAKTGYPLRLDEGDLELVALESTDELPGRFARVRWR